MDQSSAGYLEPPAVEPSLRVPVRGPRLTAWLLRVLVTLHALAAVAQPVLAGAYLQGAFDAIGLHSGNAVLVLVLSFFGSLAGVPYWLRNGSARPLLVLSAMWLLEGFQMGMGYALVMAVHIPLGVAIVAGAVWLLVWIWSPASRRPRRSLR